MANKKINQLTTRSSLANNDLIAVADPDTGTAYKIAVSDIAATVLPLVGFTIDEVIYLANGSEGTSVPITALVGKTIVGVYRGVRMRKVIGTPNVGEVKFTSSTGTLDFFSGEPLAAGEYLVIDKIVF